MLMRRRLACSHPARSTFFNTASSSKRTLSTSAVLRQAEPVEEGSGIDSSFAQTRGAKRLVEHHTVEDLANLSAADVLAETGTKRESQMRHFTGAL